MAADESTDLPLLSRPILKASQRLQDLSNEILIQIIENIQDRESLLWLALCSHQFHELTEPILYAKFVQKGPKALPAFLRRLLVRPDLASRVKSFIGLACSDGEDEQDVSSFTDEDWSRVRVAVRAASINGLQEGSWIEALYQGRWDPLTALLLCVMPNLEELKLEDWGISSEEEPTTTFIDTIFELAKDMQNRGVKSPSSLSSLKSVSLSYWDTESGMTFPHLDPFLKLRSVAEFEAFAVIEDCGDIFEDAQPPSFTYWTKDLTLRNAVINHPDMIYRFKAFKCLEKIYYELGSASVGYAPFAPPLMMQALVHLKSCLKDLTILTDEYAMDYGSDFEDYPIGSFASFEKLTSIDVTSNILIGLDPADDDSDDDENNVSANTLTFPKHQRLIDCLPPALKYLSLRNIRDHHITHIYDLLTQERSKTPRLTHLNLHWEGVTYPDKPSPKTPILHEPFTEEQVDEIMLLCENVGIELVMEFPPPRAKFLSYERRLTEEELRKRNLQSGLPADTLGPVMITETRTFRYPYEELVEFCREQGIDLENAEFLPGRGF